jgi:hypothetical protein
MLWRACINMAALHSITGSMDQTPEQEVKFKSPDYQRSMEELRNTVGNASDYDKFLLFLGFEKIETSDLFGSINHAPQPARPVQVIPYLKGKLLWS